MDEVKEKTINLTASDVEACRICLATDIKLHSLLDTHVGTCIRSIGVFTDSVEGLPNYVCYECAPVLIKCNKLLKKSKLAQTTLLEILNKNGQISKPLIEVQKKSSINLQSSLDSFLLLNYFHIEYDNDSNTSDFIKTDTDPNEKINIKLKNEIKEESGNEVPDSEIMKIIEILKTDEEIAQDLANSDSDVETIEVDVPVVEIVSDDEKMGDDFISLKSYDVKMDAPINGLLVYDDRVPQYKKNKMRPIGLKKQKKEKQKKTLRRLKEPPTLHQDEDKFVRRYFNIETFKKPGRTTTKKYFCKSCPETYDYMDEARDHTVIGCQIASMDRNRPSFVTPELPASTAMSSQQNIWKEWHGGTQ